MLINSSQKVRSKLLTALLFLFCLLPLQSFTVAQEVVNDSVSVSESTGDSVVDAISEEDKLLVNNETEEEKKKKKDKIQLDETFYISLLINLTAIAFIIFFVYYPNYKKLDTIFTFVLFNVVIFILTYVLNQVKISMGAAFGLFAVFSMLRYRTQGIGIKDMTYLFIFIALGLISGIQLEFHELGILAGVVFLVTLVLDTKLILKRKESTGILRYEKVEMIRPERHPELIQDLRQRTGLDIHRISVSEIDYLKDTAMITYYYYE